MAYIKEIIGEEVFNVLSEEKREELGKKNFEDISTGSFVPKKKHEDATQEAKTYKGRVEDRDGKIYTLKEKYKNVDDLQEQITKLQGENETQKETYEKQLEEIAFSNALEKGLGNYNVKDKTLIMAL